jgi:hypothetical protein
MKLQAWGTQVDIIVPMRRLDSSGDSFGFLVPTLLSTLGLRCFYEGLAGHRVGLVSAATVHAARLRGNVPKKHLGVDLAKPTFPRKPLSRLRPLRGLRLESTLAHFTEPLGSALLTLPNHLV